MVRQPVRQSAQPAWRSAVPSDVPELVRMMLALYAEDPAPTEMTRDKAVRTLERLFNEPVRGVAIVCTVPDAGMLAGYALLCSFWSNELGGEICIIDELFIGPESRSQGLATTLIQDLLKRSAPWFQDAVAIELEVTPGNQRARALYERLGFKGYKNALMRHHGG
jgi:ribosomal protein S18 acetylase RimI-like enzyme